MESVSECWDKRRTEGGECSVCSNSDFAVEKDGVFVQVRELWGAQMTSAALVAAAVVPAEVPAEVVAVVLWQQMVAAQSVEHGKEFDRSRHIIA
jgi:hypothetical protein